MSPFHFHFHFDSLIQSLSSLSTSQIILISLLSIPALFIIKRTLFPSSTTPSSSSRLSEDRALDEDDPSDFDSEIRKESEGSSGDTNTNTSVMSPENAVLDPPRDTPFRLEELRQFDGSDSSKPIYVSIKGTVFDVTQKREMYGPGKSYNIFAGKDGSRGLGMSSLKEDDAVPDYTTLPPNERKVLDDWYSFFAKRYNIVGRVVDLPEAVANASL